MFNAWLGRWCPVLRCLGSLLCSERDWDLSSASIHPGYWGWPCSQEKVMEGLPSSGFPVDHWGCNNRWVVLSLSAGACETSNLLIISEPLRWTAGTWFWAGQLWEKEAHSCSWRGHVAGNCSAGSPHMAASSHWEETGIEGEMGQLQRDTACETGEDLHEDKDIGRLQDTQISSHKPWAALWNKGHVNRATCGEGFIFYSLLPLDFLPWDHTALFWGSALKARHPQNMVRFPKIHYKGSQILNSRATTQLQVMNGQQVLRT